MQFLGKTNSKTALAVLAAAAVLGACSAGGPPDTTTNTPSAPTAADLVVSVDKSTIADTGADHATITVTAVDASRNVVADVPVTIVPDRNGVITASSPTTAKDTGAVVGTLGIGSASGIYACLWTE